MEVAGAEVAVSVAVDSAEAAASVVEAASLEEEERADHGDDTTPVAPQY